MSDQWLSVLRTGEHSDTFIFVVGVFQTEDEAKSAADYLAYKSYKLGRRAGDAFAKDDWDLGDEIERSHAAMFKQEWFPPPEKWKVSALDLKRTPLRLF